jgi:hypothetical protein
VHSEPSHTHTRSCASRGFLSEANTSGATQTLVQLGSGLEPGLEPGTVDGGLWSCMDFSPRVVIHIGE